MPTYWGPMRAGWLVARVKMVSAQLLILPGSSSSQARSPTRGTQTRKKTGRRGEEAGQAVKKCDSTLLPMSALTIFRAGRSRALQPLRCLAKSSHMAASEILPHELVEEERIPGYVAETFYPARPGELLHGRYKILTKLGFGSSSTVWLGKDMSRCAITPSSQFSHAISNIQSRWFWQSNRYVTLKIVVSDAGNDAKREVAISKCLRTNPTHKGFLFVREMVDHFEISGPNGIHQCLVYEPMRESMTLFQRRFTDVKIPVFLAKQYTIHMLLALDYLHSECKIIHTGKEDRTCTSHSILTIDFYRYQARQHYDGL